LPTESFDWFEEVWKNGSHFFINGTQAEGTHHLLQAGEQFTSERIYDSHNCPGWNLTDEDAEASILFYNCTDYVKVQGFSILNFTWYQEALKDIGNGFSGFAPRFIWPTIKVKANGFDATNFLLILDTELEQQIGLGPMFNPKILGKDEVMLSQGMMDYLQIEIGDTVVYEMDVDVPEQNTALLGTLDLMTMLSGVPHPITEKMLLGSTTTLTKDLTVVGSYEKSNGKFNAAYGNVLLTDCTYIFEQALDFAQEIVNEKYKYKPKKLAEATAVITFMNNYLISNDMTMCDYAYMIDGVLDDQAYYYTTGYDEIQ